MFTNLKFSTALVMLVFIAIASMTNSASAVTVEIAKKCNDLLAKAYPPREPGNPAAGSANGTAIAAQDYFNKCLTNGGNMDDHTPPGKDQPPPAPK